MFVMQNQSIEIGAIRNLQVKSLNNKGVREFKKLISFLSLRDRLVLQRTPCFINHKISNMQNRKRENVVDQKYSTAPEVIINEFLQTEDLELHKQNLHELLMAFVLYYEAPSKEWKNSIVFTYNSIHELFNSIQTAKI